MKVLADLVFEYRVSIAVILFLGWIQSNLRIDNLQRELDDLKRERHVD